MRPPIPTVTISRRAKIALWTVGILIAIIVALVQLTGVYINYLWFGSVGHRGVYTTVFWTRATLFGVFGVLMALIIGGNIVIAYLLSPPFRPMSQEQQNIERYRAVLEPRRILVLIGVAVIALFSAGLSAQGNWQTWQLWLHGGSFGEVDPQFHKDISFYAWDYPVYRQLLGFGFSAIVFSILLAVLVHYLTGAIRLQTPGPKVTLAARRHLTILAFFFIVLKAIAYWLDRFGLVFSDRSKFTGASYTDVHAVLPSRTILFWIAIVIAVGLVASLWLRSTLLPGIAFVSMLILSILISGIYPAILQQASVNPNASSKEAPYIKRNIDATRSAYNIETKTAKLPDADVTYNDSYPAVAEPSTSYLKTANPTVDAIRVLDPNVLTQTFTQLQQIKNVYGFPSKLDMDRYTVNGSTSDYVVSVRELDQSNLNGVQTNWINQHTVYTHGYGFVAAAADVDVTNNPALFTEKNIPEAGPLGLTNPLAYYGELLPDYSIVGAKGNPQEYNASDGDKITYKGSGGVSLGNLFTRLAFALNYKQTNFVLNDAASASGAKIIFNRDPRQIVQKVAPFLKVDSDPFPFVDKKSGDMMWMVDGYTTIDNFPYSERQSLSSLTNDSLAADNKTAKQPDDQINYIRNSVKATVDAYTGEVKLYAWDGNDPVLKAWMSVFPGVVQPVSSMPLSVRDHVRYPEDLFEIQRALIGTYHVDDPVKFYNAADKWTVPVDPNLASANQPPYYVLASDPKSAANSPSKPEFQLTTPMIVNGKQNLAAYISVDSDPTGYGKFTVLRVPSSAVTKGPEQVRNILQTDSVISKDLSLFNNAGGGSTVVPGNLLTLPIGNAFLYVEPLYLQSTSGSSYPILKRVLVVYGNKVGYGATLTSALSNLDDPTTGAADITTGNTTPPTSSTPTPTPTKSGAGSTTSASSGSALPGGSSPQLKAAYDDLQSAIAAGDKAKIADALSRIEKLAANALTASPSASSSAASPSGAPSSTP